MRTARHLGLMLVAAAAGCVENQTLLREERCDIMSPFYDVRLDEAGVRAGCPLRWPDALVTIGVSEEAWAWAGSSVLLNAPGTPPHAGDASLVERRTVSSIWWRQSVWTPLPWDAELDVDDAVIDRESQVSGLSATQEAVILADPRVQLLLPLYQDRYAGVLVGGGLSIPTGSSEDWFSTHRSIGGVFSLRLSSAIPGIPFLTCAASAEYRVVPHATQSIYTAVPVIAVTTGYHGSTASAAVAYRWSRWMASGVLMRGDAERFSAIQGPGIGTPVTEQVRVLVPGAFLRLMLPPCWFWSLEATRLAVGPESWHRYALGGSLTLLPW